MRDTVFMVLVCMVGLLSGCALDGHTDVLMPELEVENVIRIELEREGQLDVFELGVDGSWYFSGMEMVDSMLVNKWLAGISELKCSGTACDASEPLLRVGTLRISQKFRATPLTLEFRRHDRPEAETICVSVPEKSVDLECVGHGFERVMFEDFDSILQSAQSNLDR